MSAPALSSSRSIRPIPGFASTVGGGEDVNEISVGHKSWTARLVQRLPDPFHRLRPGDHLDFTTIDLIYAPLQFRRPRLIDFFGRFRGRRLQTHEQPMGQIRTLGFGEGQRSVDEIGVQRHTPIFLWNVLCVKDKPPKLTLPLRLTPTYNFGICPPYFKTCWTIRRAGVDCPHQSNLRSRTRLPGNFNI